MPVYTVTDPISKRTVKLTGDAPPTEAELTEIFAQINRPEKPVRGEDYTARTGPEGSAASRAGGSFLSNLLPSTTASDYLEGPMQMAAHPIDSIGLLLDAIKNAHVEQASKTADGARKVVSEPTMGGKMGAISETLGHGLATLLPVVGPAAAHVGEQGASGDVAGMIGGTGGLLTSMFAPKAIEGVSKASTPVRAAVAGKLEGSAIGQMERALNPTRIDTKVKAARVVPEMLKRRIVAKDLPALEARAANAADVAGGEVDRALSNSSNKTAAVKPLVADLERAKQPYIGERTDGGTVVNEPARVKAIQKLQDTLTEYGDKVSVESMVKLRRGWDEIVNAARGFVQPDLKTNIKAWAAREGRSALRDALAKTVPDINEINAEFAFWQNIEDVARATNERRVGQSRNLTSTIAAAGGAVAAEAVLPGSGALMGAAKGIAGFKFAGALKKLVESPGYQMFSAVQKQRLADALMSKNPRVAEQAIATGLRTVAARPRPSYSSGNSASAPAFANNPRMDRQQDAGGSDDASGQIEAGNIDLHSRPRVKNRDGSISTVRSISINEDGKEILIPTVSDDGRILSEADAVRLYHKTGRHLGMFRDASSATAYAKRLHEAQAKEYAVR